MTNSTHLVFPDIFDEPTGDAGLWEGGVPHLHLDFGWSGGSLLLGNSNPIGDGGKSPRERIEKCSVKTRHVGQVDVAKSRMRFSCKAIGRSHQRSSLSKEPGTGEVSQSGSRARTGSGDGSKVQKGTWFMIWNLERGRCRVQNPKRNWNSFTCVILSSSSAARFAEG